MESVWERLPRWNVPNYPEGNPEGRSMKGHSVIRSFEVRASKKDLVCDLSRDLDSMLIKLQQKGWKIISVTSTPVREWDYPNWFDSTLFTIVAEYEDTEQ